MVTIEHRTRLLRACEARPRVLTDFTQGEVHETVLAKHTERWLDELRAEGLLRLHEGWYHITAAGIDELVNLTAAPSMAVARVHCNAAMRQSYVPPSWNVRAGGLQHRQYGSVGIDA